MTVAKFVDYERADKPDGFGTIVMHEALTMPESQQYRRGFNAGHRNRRLAMELPVDEDTGERAGPEFFGTEAYGTGYFNGWNEADVLIRRGSLGYAPCAMRRGEEFERRRKVMEVAQHT